VLLAQVHPSVFDRPLLTVPLEPQQALCAALAVVVVIPRHLLIDDVEQDRKLVWVLRLAGPQPLQSTAKDSVNSLVLLLRGLHPVARSGQSTACASASPQCSG
jgi:hypothetical protein